VVPYGEVAHDRGNVVEALAHLERQGVHQLEGGRPGSHQRRQGRVGGLQVGEDQQARDTKDKAEKAEKADKLPGNKAASDNKAADTATDDSKAAGDANVVNKPADNKAADAAADKAAGDKDTKAAAADKAAGVKSLGQDQVLCMTNAFFESARLKRLLLRIKGRVLQCMHSGIGQVYATRSMQHSLDSATVLYAIVTARCA
jgi:chemotaxis protein histidine kinase CheA